MARPFVAPLAMMPLVASLALVGAGCSGGLGHRSIATIQGEAAIPPGVTSVEFELEDGSVTILRGAPGRAVFRGQIRRAADGPEQLALLESAGVDLGFALDPAKPGVLCITAPSRPQGAELAVLAVEVQIDLPPELALAIRVRGSGNLRVADREAAMDLECGRGDLRLEHTRGGAKLHTGRGNVIADEHSGDLDIVADAGDMQVFVKEPGARLRLVTGMGNLQCLVPADTQFRVDARTETGKLANGFGLAMQKGGYSAWMTGQRGDGRTELVMHSGRGHLSLSHKVFR